MSKLTIYNQYQTNVLRCQSFCSFFKYPIDFSTKQRFNGYRPRQAGREGYHMEYLHLVTKDKNQSQGYKLEENKATGFYYSF
jgi:hypothetical protein